MSKNILEKISAQVQLRMEDRKKKVPLRDLEILGAAQPQAQSLNPAAKAKAP